jgi:hypothetical protein
MGTVGVFIGVGLSVSIEKVFHQVSDNCEENSWGAAWGRYREKASGWQLLITFIDSAIGNDLVSIFAGGLGEAVAYLLNPETGGNLKSASEFRVTIFFTKFVKGCATSAVTDVLLRFAKHGKAVITKVTGNDLPPELERQLVRELSALFPFFLKYRERAVRAWKLAVNSGFPRAWTSDPDFLIKLRNVWDYRFVNGNTAKLPNVELIPTSLIKVSSATLQQMRSVFNLTVKPNFLKSLGNRSDIGDMLSKAGFNSSEVPVLIQRLKSGQGITGHQVHHKIPLDLGGTNDVSNLVLMKNSPYHTAVTSFQNSKISIPAGETRMLDFPSVPGNFYSPPYIQ